MMTKNLITSKDPKGLHAVSLFEAAYNKICLTDEQAQMFNEKGGEFKDGVQKLIRELVTSNQYANQAITSEYTYPGEFQRKNEEEQIEILLKKVLKTDPKPIMGHLKKFMVPAILPSGCHLQDGNYAIISPFGFQKLIPGYKNPFDPELYCKSLLYLFGIISKDRNFYNYKERQIDKSDLLLVGKTLEAYKTIANIQGESPVWIIQAQLGFLHKGESANRARELFRGNEFGLGPTDGGSIAISHPGRFFCLKELDMNLPGAKFSLSGDGVLSETPVFGFNGAQLLFGAHNVSFPCECYGSASAFL